MGIFFLSRFLSELDYSIKGFKNSLIKKFWSKKNLRIEKVFKFRFGRCNVIF